jgi:hypothetical protein
MASAMNCHGREPNSGEPAGGAGTVVGAAAEARQVPAQIVDVPIATFERQDVVDATGARPAFRR